MFVNKVARKLKSTLKNIEFQLLKKRVKNYGYNLIKERPPTYSEIVLENFFRTNYGKNALLSYIIYPFVEGIKNHHSNNRECYTIAEILNELGYNVDVINWDNISYIPAKNYEVVIDNHNNLKRLNHYFGQSTKKIFHATNAHWLYQNWIEYGRYYDFFLQKGIAITPPRLMTEGNSAEYCDAISMFGNDFTEDTYGQYRDKVYHLPMSVTSATEMMERDYSTAKRKFVWLNSRGALLKGLDIVVGAFSKLGHLELYVCGDVTVDTEFREAIADKLSKASNITMMGWVDLNGDVFRKLSSECGWIICTSFSEGGGGSILNCMAKGLIPVVSKTSSLNLKADTGFFLEQNDADSLARLINSISTIADKKLKKMSYNAYSFVAHNHTSENFKSEYKQFLIKILD